MASLPSIIFSVSRLGEATEPQSRWSRPMTDGRGDLAGFHEVVDDEAEPFTLAIPEPANAGGQPLELDLIMGHLDPLHQVLVVGEIP